MQFIDYIENYLLHLMHIILICFPVVLLLGMEFELLKHIWPKNEDSTLSKFLRSTFCIAVVVITLIAVDKKIFGEPLTTSEQLNEISEEIGIDGILDYVLGRWDSYEVAEYIFPEFTW